MNMNNKKITILMPTFNHGDTILESLDSIKNQSYCNWELIVVDDGSTDNTKKIISGFIDDNILTDKIRYIYQDNADQLRALLNGVNYATGDLIMLLHSDDKFYSNKSLEKVVTNFTNDDDALLFDYNLIDDESRTIGKQKVDNIASDKQTIAKILLFLGRNIYADHFVATKEIMQKVIKDTYLTWNQPFYLKFTDKSVSTIKLRSVHSPIMSYRVHGGNYINNPIGELNVLNGELRTAVSLMQNIDIPFYQIQFYLYRLLNKLNINYTPYTLNGKSKNIYNIIKFIYKKSLRLNSYKDNLFLLSLLKFYKSNSTRTINVVIPENEEIYLGCDMRKFNKALVNNKLSKFYVNMLSEMSRGFSKIKCSDKRMYDVAKFLCIDAKVEIAQ